VVEGSGNGYLRTACDYVHLNPVRAGLLKPEAPLESYRWSSYGEYLKEPSQRSFWLRVDRLLGEKGIPGDTEAGRQQFAALSEKRRAEESAADYEQLRRDWVLGSEEFRRELLAAMVGRVGPNHYGAERQETGLQKAERIVKEELERMGWPEVDLRGRAKGHPGKVVIARRLRQETTMSLKWIAERLQMGTWTYVSNLLNERAEVLTAQELLPLCQ
jgi:putative transposase